MFRFLSSLLPKTNYTPIDDLELPSRSPTSARPTGPRRRLLNLRNHAPLVYLLLLHIASVALLFKAWAPPPLPSRGAWSPYSEEGSDGEDPGKPEWDMSPEGLARFGVDALYERQSTTLRQATARYELKTGRRTPRGFEKWFEWVSSRGLLVDEYDQVRRFLPLLRPAFVEASELTPTSSGPNVDIQRLQTFLRSSVSSSRSSHDPAGASFAPLSFSPRVEPKLNPLSLVFGVDRTRLWSRLEGLRCSPTSREMGEFGGRVLQDRLTRCTFSSLVSSFRFRRVKLASI